MSHPRFQSFVFEAVSDAAKQFSKPFSARELHGMLPNKIRNPRSVHTIAVILQKLGFKRFRAVQCQRWVYLYEKEAA